MNPDRRAEGGHGANYILVVAEIYSLCHEDSWTITNSV